MKKLYSIWLQEYFEGHENHFNALLDEVEFSKLTEYLIRLKNKKTLADFVIVEADQLSLTELKNEIKDWLSI